jgi:hypothetical protein
MLAVAQIAASVQLRYAQRGDSLAQAALAGAPSFVEMRHYPKGDVSDAETGHRFYYHAHRRDEPEHGHFHLFAFDRAQPHGFAHLAALSLDRTGQATRWFTTNQWVTGGQWMAAEDVLTTLERFSVRTQGRLAPVARWLTAMVQLFQPQLRSLLHDRDAALKRFIDAHVAHDRSAVLADRAIDVLSETPAHLPTRIAELIEQP